MASQATLPAANVELVRAGFEAFNVEDAEVCLALAALGLVINLAELPEPQHVAARLRDDEARVPRPADAHGGHHRRPGQGRRPGAVSGTHSAEFLGIPATGRTVEYVGHEFYRVADGLIAEEWICSDMATLLRHLG